MKPRQALQLITAHKNQLGPERDRLDKFHDWYLAQTDRSQQWVDEDFIPSGDNQLSLETNYPYAWIDTMTATICPSNPQITVKARNPDAKEIGQRRMHLANDTMRRNKLYKRGWRVAGHAALAGYGVTKTYWNFRKRSPFTVNINPRRFFWDRGVEEWDDVSYCIEATVLRKDQFLARATARRTPAGKVKASKYKPSVAKQAKFSGWPDWLNKPGFDTRQMGRDAGKGVLEFVVVYEVYDFVGNNYWHMLDSCEEPLFSGELPYKWVRNPFDLVVFNDNLEDTTGISDVHLIANHQERLNEIDTLELWHVLGSMPVSLIDEGGLDNPEAFLDAIQNATGPNAVARANVKGGKSIRDVITSTPTPQLSPDWQRMRGRVEKMIGFTLGLAQFMRGGSGDADHATEVALADAGIRTRNGRRVRTMEEWQSSVAKKIVALWGEMHERDQPIPVREPGKEDTELYDFDDLGFDDAESFEQDWWFEYDSAPYSPTENHALIQLQKLQQFAPILLESQWVDNEKFITKLLELLRMVELKAADGGAAAMPVPGQPGAPGAAGTPGNDAAVQQGVMPSPQLEQVQAFINASNPAPEGVSEPGIGS